jgi:hypothetical protein
MMLGSVQWQEETIVFTAKDTCSAVVVRVRRLPSRRFDSKIAGTLWLDDFHLASIQNASGEKPSRSIRLSENYMPQPTEPR